ncbi:isoaspartyl peptidase/L-asparaginase isoform X2 [Heterodontus francisci]|uniref:isoaspartyl peptidase/L-asparaginase isoform X2 n=1 Tax=Heterodontus francisci TaxID=7792 RepID=UPI00355BD763
MCTRKPVIVAHGGCGKYTADRKEECLLEVMKAALQGYRRLQQGGSALDTVEEASVILENHPLFNAGCGSVLNECGETELDAMIMDGKSLDAGAVAAVRNIANPTKLARLVLEQTKHVILSDRGASRFAKAVGFPEVPMESLITKRSRERWQRKFQTGSAPVQSQIELGTIGAVALDTDGNVACATSTGGLNDKMVGRIGDTPCIGMSPAEAADISLKSMWTRLQSLAGAIVVNSAGDWAAKFTTENMPWAAITDDMIFYGVALGEVRTSGIEDIPQ